MANHILPAGSDNSDDGDDDAGRAGYWGEGAPTGRPIPKAEYDELVLGMVGDAAPRRFAIVQDWGTHVDGRIAAWGISTDDRTYIVDADDGPQLSMDSIRLALILYSRAPHLAARVLWIDGEHVRAADELAAAYASG